MLIKKLRLKIIMFLFVRKSIFPCLLLVIVLFSCNRSDFSLTGTVFSNEGTPLKDMKVSLYSCAGDRLKTPHAVVKTETDGTFKFSVVDGQPYILEISGELGAGRIYIPADSLSGKLTVTYPVTEKIVILHTNDLHFHLNNIGEFAEKTEKIKKKNNDVFLFCAGDVVVRHSHKWIINGRLMGDTNWYGSRALEMVNTMNTLGYDLLTLGNHEFDFIEYHTRNALEAANFPLLAANIEVTTDKLPPVVPYVIFKTSTYRRLSVLGLSTCNSGKEGLNELDVDETVEQYISLRDSSDVFIALTHIGLQNDYLLAEKFPDFDVIIGGHSHAPLMEAVEMNSVLVAHGGGSPHIVSSGNPSYLGKIVLILENGAIIEKRGWVVKITGESESCQSGVHKAVEMEVPLNQGQ
jgi:2',3'-cyclic-nucleotide 2'-phosphodiesterase (5'-nucleotidase family)